MALQKQNIDIAFNQGVDTKTDPWRVQAGKFLALENSIFSKTGALTKRNGFGLLPALPVTNASYLTTFEGDLTAIGSSLYAFSSGTQSWINQGVIQPVSVSTLSLIKNNNNQTQVDSAVSPLNQVCTVYSELNNATTTYKYAIADITTGQNLVPPTAIVPGSSGTVSGAPRVFQLGEYFVILFTNTVSGPTYHLQYVAININTFSVTAAADIINTYTPASTVAFNGVVANNVLYIAWNAVSAGGLKMNYLDSTLTLHTATNPDASHKATIISMCADITGSTPVIYTTYWDASATTAYIVAVNHQLSSVLSATQVLTATAVANISSVASSGVCTIFYEVTNAYTYDAGIPTNYISSKTCTQAGTVSAASAVSRSVGLASKAFLIGTTPYFLVAYKSPYQPSYFLMNGTGKVVAKLAYSNGGGYLTTGLPYVYVSGSTAMVSYLVKDMIQAVSKDNGASVGGIYTQTGINLATFTFGNSSVSVAETAKNLHLSGGFLWLYDGFNPVEHGFFLYPDSVNVATATGSGSLSAQQYYYHATYEWTDNQGNIHRSAPSIPVAITTTTSSSTNTIKVPTLRLTYKTDNPVKIVLYRWSAAQQTYYQVTSLTAPTLNDMTVDYVTITDAAADATILGNNIIYTNGGVLENIAAPACSVINIFDTRLWLVDAENPDILWFSKPILEATPVEMTDLQTVYVSPTLSAQGSTGHITALAAMDDKNILFKKNAIYFINGVGPDATGSSNQYSQPTFITATVGCMNQNSIVFQPGGLMFQSDKGIWLLSRNLTTTYIGWPVESYTLTAEVVSAIAVPGTNQVRFMMDSGITLVYDYYFDQWSTFTGINGISSTLYGNLHTFIDASGNTYQETQGVYLDGSRPTLMKFTTSWVGLAGIQGFQRVYWGFLLGQYASPHKLNVGIAYDFNSAITQQVVITPDNHSPAFGVDTPFGSGTPFGGVSLVEQWQINFKQQTCESFQMTVSEQYDSSVGPVAAAGLTLSSLGLVIGLKKQYPRRLPESRKIG